jgi:hypothetical protein
VTSFPLAFAAGWGSRRVLIRARSVQLDVTGAAGDTKTINVALELGSSQNPHLYLTKTGVTARPSGTVKFARPVQAGTLAIWKYYSTRVVFDELILTNGCIETSQACQEQPTPGTACHGITILNLASFGGSVPPEASLTVSGFPGEDPVMTGLYATSFQVTSLALDELGTLLFYDDVPAAPPPLVAKYNLTNFGPLAASYIAENNHNGSFFDEFDRSEPYAFPHICGSGFSSCTAWLEKLVDREITDNDLGNGARGEISFACGPAPEAGYKIVFPLMVVTVASSLSRYMSAYG